MSGEVDAILFCSCGSFFRSKRKIIFSDLFLDLINLKFEVLNPIKRPYSLFVDGSGEFSMYAYGSETEIFSKKDFFSIILFYFIYTRSLFDEYLEWNL